SRPDDSLPERRFVDRTRDRDPKVGASKGTLAGAMTATAARTPRGRWRVGRGPCGALAGEQVAKRRERPRGFERRDAPADGDRACPRRRRARRGSAARRGRGGFFFRGRGGR